MGTQVEHVPQYGAGQGQDEQAWAEDRARKVWMKCLRRKRAGELEVQLSSVWRHEEGEARMRWRRPGGHGKHLACLP